MRAITVTSWGTTPKFTSDAPSPPTPTPDSGTTQIQVLASGLPQLVRSQASGTHYSVRDAPLPYTPGIDGVGYTIPDNKLAYFQTLTNKPSAGGAFAETVTIANNAIFPIPLPPTTQSNLTDQKALAIKIASLINPALSSWMALTRRAHISDLQTPNNQPDGFNVLILGVTSTSGRLAALLSRHLGATQIIGVARNTTTLNTLLQSRTIDHAITLDPTDPTKTDYSLLNTVRAHIVLDYIYGPHALSLLSALPNSPSKADDLEVRYVHIGTLGKEADLAVPGTLLRSKNIVLSGSGPGSWSIRALSKELPGLIEAVVDIVGDDDDESWREEYGVVERGLEDVEAAFGDGVGRTVFVMDR